MNSEGVTEPQEVIKDGAGETTPVRGMQAYYAVANGKQHGIYPFWQYEFPALSRCPTLLTTSSETELKVKYQSGACHKRFRTRSQAEAFIEDWKDSLADVWREEIKNGLDQGLRPRNMKFSAEDILIRHDEQTEDADALDKLKLDKLSFKEEE